MRLSKHQQLKFLWAIAWAAMLCAYPATVRAEKEIPPDPAQHTVIVPYDASKSLQGLQPDRFYLDYDEFQRLWKLAKEARESTAPDKDEKGDPTAAIVAALYQTEIFEDRLHIEARIQVLTRGRNWATLAFPFVSSSGTVAISSVLLDGQPAGFENQKILIEHPGTHQVEIHLDLRQDRGWRKISATIPPSPASVLAVTVPSTDGRPGFHSTLDPFVTETSANGKRVFTTALGAESKLDLTRTIARQRVSDVPPATVTNDIHMEVHPRLEKISARISFRFAGTERSRFALSLDESVRPIGWDSSYLRSWEMRKEKGRLMMDITLTQPVTDEYVITLLAERVQGAAAGERSTPVISGEALKKTTVWTLESTEDLQLKPGAGTSAERVATNTTPGKGMLLAGSWRLGAESSLPYSVSMADDHSRVTVQSVYQLATQKAEILSTIVLDTGRASLPEVRIGLPKDYEVQSLLGPSITGWHREGDELRVRFSEFAGKDARIALHIARSTPQAQQTWSLERLKFDQFRNYQGTILVATQVTDEVKLSYDANNRQMREADPAEVSTEFNVKPPFSLKRALRVETANWSAQVNLQRQPLRFVADAVLLAQASNSGWKFSQQLGLFIEQGGMDRVVLQMPKTLPAATVLGKFIRDVQSKVAGDVREYTVTFQSDVLDRTDLSLEFDLPLNGAKTLPVIKVPGADRLRTFLVADNNSSRELKLSAQDAERTVSSSLPFLPAGLQQPSYFQARENSLVTVSSIQLESTAGNSAIITLEDVTTALRPNGERWEIVEWSLANRSLQFLPVSLPASAEVVEVSVSGQTVRADRAAGSGSNQLEYLIPLIQMRAGELSQQVRMIYRLPPNDSSLPSKLTLLEPELRGLSAERTLWHVWTPRRFDLKKWDGNMEEVPEIVVEDERNQQKLADVSRLNRLLKSIVSDSRASSNEAKEAVGNARKALEEVRTYQQRQSPRRGTAVRAVESAPAQQKAQAQVSQSSEELQRNVVQQGQLLDQNWNELKKVAGTDGQKPSTYNFNNSASQTANANWGDNAAGQLKIQNANTYNGGTVISGGQLTALNDNVGLNSSFLAPSATSITGAGGITKAGAGTFTLNGATITLGGNSNTYTGSTTANAGGTFNGSFNVTQGNLGTISGNITTSNARASQGSQTLVANGNGGQLNIANNNALGMQANGTPTKADVNGIVTLNNGATLNSSSNLTTYAQNSTVRNAPLTGTPGKDGQQAAEAAREIQNAVASEKLGRFDDAITSYQNALRADSSNLTARRGMEKVEQEKAQYYEASRDHTRAKMLGMVDKEWEDRTPVTKASPMKEDDAVNSIAEAKVKKEQVRRLGGPFDNGDFARAGGAGGIPAAGAAPAAAADPFAAAPRAAGAAAAATPEEPATPQLKPAGRVSLVVNVPMEGTVYHFRKLKDHAILDITLKKEWNRRQISSLWTLAIGGLLLVAMGWLASRWRSHRARATA